MRQRSPRSLRSLPESSSAKGRLFVGRMATMTSGRYSYVDAHESGKIIHECLDRSNHARTRTKCSNRASRISSRSTTTRASSATTTTASRGP